VQRERELILAEPDVHKQADLLALAVAIASRNFDGEFLRFVFRKELEQMQGATLLDEWVEERVQQQVAAQVAAQLAKASEQAREQGLQQGLQQGKLEQQRETILHTLRLRFALSSEQFESVAERLAEVTDHTQLRTLFDVALRAYTWSEFQTALDQTATSESTSR
jgi:hypothetical protein